MVNAAAPTPLRLDRRPSAAAASSRSNQSAAASSTVNSCAASAVVVERDLDRELFAANGGVGQVDAARRRAGRRAVRASPMPSPCSLESATARSVPGRDAVGRGRRCASRRAVGVGRQVGPEPGLGEELAHARRLGLRRVGGAGGGRRGRRVRGLPVALRRRGGAAWRRARPRRRTWTASCNCFPSGTRRLVSTITPAPWKVSFAPGLMVEPPGIGAAGIGATAPPGAARPAPVGSGWGTGCCVVNLGLRASRRAARSRRRPAASSAGSRPG